MRWGDPITTTVRGQGRLLGSKLAWVFQSRRRITIFVLLVAVIASSVTYGIVTLNNKNAFRAAEDDNTELSGLDYVEDTTQGIFSQKFAPIPPEQLSDYDKIALTTELAGANYFRLSTATERQGFLAAWDTSPEWRQFATQAESGEEGAWQWLDWLKPYCDGGGVAKSPSLFPTAQAQSSNACILQLAELQTKKIVKAGEYVTLFDFEFNWKNFFGTARDKCITGGEPGNICAATAKYFKTYYSSGDLDLLYNRYWKDIKNRRTARNFNTEEVGRLKKIDKYFQLKLRGEIDEAYRVVANLEIQIVLFAVPIERPIMAVVKGGGKLLGVGVDLLSHAPLGTTTRTAQIVTARGALQAARIAERFKTIASGPLAGFKINVSRMFAGSKLAVPATPSSRSTVDLFVDSWANVMNKMANDREVYDAVYTTRSDLTNQFESLASKSYVVSARQMSNILTNGEGMSSGKICSSYACAIQGTGETFYNEEMITLFANMHGVPTFEANEQVVLHEMSHHFSKWGITKEWNNYYSYHLGYNPIEEGAVDSTADYLAVKFGYSPANFSIYGKEKIWFNEVVKAIDRGKKLKKIKGSETGRQLSMSYLYRYGLNKLDEVLVPGLPPGQGASVIKESFYLFDANSPDHAIALVKALYR